MKPLLLIEPCTGYCLKVEQDHGSLIVYAKSRDTDWMPAYEAKTYNEVLVFISYTLTQYLEKGFL